MKKLLFCTLFTLYVLVVTAQCYTIPPATATLNLPATGNDWNNGASPYQNKTTTYFNGNSAVANNVSFNGITNFVFNGTFNVNNTLNLGGNANVYIPVGNTVTFSSISMNGGDTIFVQGNVIINNLVVNNSTSSKPAVIFTSTGSSVKIGGTAYVPSTFYQSGNNITNRAYIVAGCITTLPVKFHFIEVTMSNE